MKKTMMIMTAIMAMAAAQPALAADDGHMHGHNMDAHNQMEKGMGDMQNKGKMKDMFLVKKDIDGYTVTFHAMKAKEGMQHSGTHNVMVKVEKNGKTLTNLMMNSKVTHPNKKSESKMLMKMGDWYMTSYDLGHQGQHKLMVLFKTDDGKKHFGGVSYPENVSK